MSSKDSKKSTQKKITFPPIDEKKGHPLTKNFRRIIVEEPSTCNFVKVPYLSDICQNQLIRDFRFNASALTDKRTTDRQKLNIINNLDVKLPLKVSSVCINDENYWKKVCQSRWKLCDPMEYDESWKKMYFERDIEEIIENFKPCVTDPSRLNEAIVLGQSIIKRLNIKHVNAAIRNIQTNEIVPYKKDIFEFEEYELVHINFSPIIEGLANLTEFRVIYEMKNVGMDFEWHKFAFTSKDCQQITDGIAQHETIQLLQLARCHLNDKKCQILIQGLFNHPSLKTLDLSHNCIGPRGALAIAELLESETHLRELCLSNNRLGPRGGMFIGEKLKKNKFLENLDLSLNYVTDCAGISICRALLDNHTLKVLNLACNSLTEITTRELAQVIVDNNVISELNLNNNNIGPVGGKQLQESMEDNKTIVHIDLRFTNCLPETLLCLALIFEQNKGC